MAQNRGLPNGPAPEEPSTPGSARHVVEGDPVTQRLIVMFLGLAVILVIIFVFLIRLDGGEVPDSLIALGSSAVGALAGFLTGTRGVPADAAARPREGGRRRDRRR